MGESLRYENLVLKKKVNKISNFKNFLVFGDIDESITGSLLNIFEKHKNKKFYIKTHPGSLMKTKNQDNITYLHENAPNLEKYDCVITCNASGAIFKPFYENYPLLIFLDTRYFNLNPVLDLDENIFFFDNKSFDNALNYTSKNQNMSKNMNRKLHIIDKRNLKWLDILKHQNTHIKYDKVKILKLIND